jgi:hypothetical protein
LQTTAGTTERQLRNGPRWKPLSEKEQQWLTSSPESAPGCKKQKQEERASTSRPVFFFFPNEEDGLIQTIIEEMGRGNFSFLILVIGILQLSVMLRKKH